MDAAGHRVLSSAKIASLSSSSGASSFLSTRSNCVRPERSTSANISAPVYWSHTHTHLVDEKEEMTVAGVQMGYTQHVRQSPYTMAIELDRARKICMGICAQTSACVFIRECGDLSRRGESPGTTVFGFCPEGLAHLRCRAHRCGRNGCCTSAHTP